MRHVEHEDRDGNECWVDLRYCSMPGDAFDSGDGGLVQALDAESGTLLKDRSNQQGCVEPFV